MKLNIKNRVNNFHGKKDKIIIFIDRYVNSSKIIPFRKSEILQSLKKRSFYNILKTLVREAAALRR